MEALDIYRSLSKPPKSALRPITDGNLKGKTDINPQWRYEAMTEMFGLVGIGWKYEVQKLWTEKGAGNEVLAFAQVAVFVRDPTTKGWSDPIVGIGGSKLINDFQRGAKSNDEGYKMAVTDAFSTSLKMIGVAADVYAGRWDGSKYKEVSEQESLDEMSPAAKQEYKQAKQAPQKEQDPGLAGGPDTPEEKAEINKLLSSTKRDGSKIFTKQDCARVGDWRKERTAQEVIVLLKNAIAEARGTPVMQPKAQPDPAPAFTPAEEAEIEAIF